jgi:hypothetical protein
MLLLWEDGHWVDYISPLTPAIALTDVVIVVLASLLPLSLIYALWRRIVRRRKDY